MNLTAGLIWIIAVAAIATSPVEAQGVFDMGVLTNTVSVPTGGGARRAPTRPTERSFTPGETAIHSISGAFGKSPVRGEDIRLAYTPTTALRRAALEGYISRIRRERPEAARVMAAQFAKNDYTKVYHDMMQGSTLRENDAVDTVTAYTLLGWQIANEHRDEIPDRQFEAVRRQIAPQLAASPRIADPRIRASLGEEMKLLYITVLAGWQSAGKEGNSERYSDGIAAMFKRQSGRDLRAIKLTDAGFSRP
jgi:hypothetical protein